MTPENTQKTSEIIIKPVTEYTPELAAQVRKLLIQLSRSGKDKGEIPASWFQEIIASPSHDLLIACQIATDGSEQLLGMASLSLILGPGIQKNAYLEDFVTDSTVRGQGIGKKLWLAMCDWARAKGAKRLEFTCGQGRESAQAFYEHHGATKYPTNFYRYEL